LKDSSNVEMERLAPAGALSVLACFCAFSAARAGEGPWLTDFEAAKAKAKAEKKLLLVDFTGSDWCVWCRKLKDQALDKEPFKTEAPKRFVLVELDYPVRSRFPRN